MFFCLQHDRIYEAALLVNFHELPLNVKQLYRFFVERCQKPALLTIGGFAPLNLDTCVKVCDWFWLQNDMAWKIDVDRLFECVFFWSNCRYFQKFIRFQWWFLLWSSNEITHRIIWQNLSLEVTKRKQKRKKNIIQQKNTTNDKQYKEQCSNLCILHNLWTDWPILILEKNLAFNFEDEKRILSAFLIPTYFLQLWF